MGALALSNVVELQRTCRKCNVVKDTSAFYKRSPSQRGDNFVCKTCKNENLKSWQKRNPVSVRNTRYKRTYGITLDQVTRMLEVQMGLCANRACGTQISIEVSKKAKNKAFIDHCHETGKVRGLLCISCNTTLGFLEQKNKVLGLTEYLHRSK